MYFEMLATIPRSAYICSFRQFSTCTTNMKQVYNPRQIRNLTRKYLSKPSNLSKADIPVNQTSITSSASVKIRKFGTTKFRYARLNKIFLEKITDIIATSDIETQTAGSGLQITAASFQLGMQSLLVYWTCSRVEDEERLNKILTKASGFINYELALQGVLGRIPQILFVRDDSFKNLVEIDKLLNLADFGPDFEASHTLDPSLTVIRDSPEESKKIDSRSDISEDGDFEELILRQDVLGLNRRTIMDTINKNIKASKGAHRGVDGGFSSSEVSMTPIPPKEQIYSRTSEIKKWAKTYRKKLKNKVKLEEINNDQINPHHYSMDDYEILEGFEDYFDDYESTNER